MKKNNIHILMGFILIINIIFFNYLYIQNNSIINKINNIEKTQIHIKECLYTIYPVSEVTSPERIENIKHKRQKPKKEK